MSYTPITPGAGVPALAPGAGPYVLGIDPSLTGLALVVLDDAGDIVTQQIQRTKPGPIMPRFELLIPPAVIACQLFEPALVVMEGLSLGSHGGAGVERTGLHFLIRWEGGFEDRLQVVPPTTLKKWVCGTGAAQKSLMQMKTLKRWGQEFEDDNLCDAYCLAQWGRAYLAGEVSLEPKAKKPRKKKEADA